MFFQCPIWYLSILEKYLAGLLLAKKTRFPFFVIMFFCCCSRWSTWPRRRSSPWRRSLRSWPLTWRPWMRRRRWWRLRSGPRRRRSRRSSRMTRRSRLWSKWFSCPKAVTSCSLLAVPNEVQYVTKRLSCLKIDFNCLAVRRLVQVLSKVKAVRKQSCQKAGSSCLKRSKLSLNLVQAVFKDLSCHKSGSICLLGVLQLVQSV